MLATSEQTAVYAFDPGSGSLFKVELLVEPPH